MNTIFTDLQHPVPRVLIFKIQKLEFHHFLLGLQWPRRDQKKCFTINKSAMHSGTGVKVCYKEKVNETKK